MRTLEALQGHSNRNQSLRLLLLLIILGTFPCYALAIFYIGSAPLDSATPTLAATFTPIGAGLISPSAPTLPTHTPLSYLPPTYTPLSNLPPTPRQFIPPTAIPIRTTIAPTALSPSPLPSPTAGIADADGDTVPDADDACPTEGGYADNQGCPYPDDPDRDGLRGEADLCPNEYAPGTARGCRDFDDDGLDSSQDDCPQQAGPVANRGCPLADDSGG